MFISVVHIAGSFFRLAGNGLRLGEGGDFTTELSYEAHTSNLRKTVIRSTEPATFAKPLLVAVAFLVVRCFRGACWLKKIKKGKGNFLSEWRGKLFTHFLLALCGCQNA